ncbi:hypothetical protein EZS27_001419 [termite gut metagenome]|uniref:Uncharacterized protein n=1 Tax=termite gut metagenome TaxID=433724 RepID=A0A5J4T0U1_9ZZZZ
MESDLKSKLATLLPRLDEHTARLYLGSEALSSGRGGKRKASRLAGVSRVRVNRGMEELNSPSQSVSMATEQGIRKKRHC